MMIVLIDEDIANDGFFMMLMMKSGKAVSTWIMAMTIIMMMGIIMDDVVDDEVS